MKRTLIIIAEIGIFLLMGFCLWFKIFLPHSYFIGGALVAILLAFSIIRERKHKSVIVQLLLVYLFLNNVYGIATHYSVLPYGDAYWEYAVVRTFSQENSVSVIHSKAYPATKLTWYSAWPYLHTSALIFSRICGIDSFLTLLIFPVILGICSFLLVYLFLERLREALDLKHELVSLGLLIYVTSPDTIFWRTQFVRQSLGMLWLLFLFYINYIVMPKLSDQKRKMAVVSLIVILSLVISHHFSSFAAMLYLFLLFVLLNIGKFIARRDVSHKLFKSTQALNVSPLGLALLMFVVIFAYWDSIGLVIWPTIESRIERVVQVFVGIRETSFFVPSPIYPDQLSPKWVVQLLRIRDVAMYVPSFLGLLLLWKKKANMFSKLFVACSTLAFGLLFVVNNLTFRVEPYRLVAMALPFVALLTAIAYGEVKRSKHVWNTLIPAVLILILSSSFVGLWGHSFAPMHLYNSSINPSDVGENTDPSSLKAFVSSRINQESFNFMWTDDIGSLLLLLQPDQFEKIRGISPELIDKLGSFGNESFWELSELDVYSYYAGAYSHIRNPTDSKIFRDVISGNLSAKFNRVYDSEMYRLWESPP